MKVMITVVSLVLLTSSTLWQMLVSGVVSKPSENILITGDLCKNFGGFYIDLTHGVLFKQT